MDMKGLDSKQFEMVKYLHTIFLLIVLVSLMVSCSKDKNNKEVLSGSLELNGEYFGLNNALLMDWGEYNGMDETYDGHHVILGLYSPEAEIIINDDQEIDSIGGIGHAVQFELFAKDPRNIVKQDFVLSGEHTTGTYSFGIVYSDFPFGTGSMWDGDVVEAGVLSLSVNGSTLSVSSSLYLESGSKAGLDYEGSYIFLQPPPEE